MNSIFQQFIGTMDKLWGCPVEDFATIWGSTVDLTSSFPVSNTSDPTYAWNFDTGLQDWVYNESTVYFNVTEGGLGFYQFGSTGDSYAATSAAEGSPPPPFSMYADISAIGRPRQCERIYIDVRLRTQDEDSTITFHDTSYSPDIIVTFPSTGNTWVNYHAMVVGNEIYVWKDGETLDEATVTAAGSSDRSSWLLDDITVEMPQANVSSIDELRIYLNPSDDESIKGWAYGMSLSTYNLGDFLCYRAWGGNRWVAVSDIVYV